MLAPVRTVAPAANLLTVDEAKAHCRVDGAEDDTLITALVQAATDHLDGWSGILGRCLINQTWRQDFEYFCDPLRLPLGPVSSVTSVKYYDGNNVLQTVSTSVYSVLTDDQGTYLTLNFGQTWPITYTREDAIQVTYVAGHGAAASNVPQAIRQAALLLIGHWYENREASIVGVPVATLPLAVDRLLVPYRRVAF